MNASRHHAAHWLIFGLAIAVAILAAAVLLHNGPGGASKNTQHAESDGEVPQLMRQIAELKKRTPESEQDYFELQRQIRALADRVVELEQVGSEAYVRAMHDSLDTTVATMARLSQPQQQQRELARFVACFSEKNLEREDVRLANAFANGLEEMGATESAREAYAEFARVFAGSSDPTLQESARWYAGAARRLALAGQPLELQGTTLDGTPFDVVSLRGKVVLVDLWATWCGPCLAEFPHLRKQYEMYKDRGYEIVGINLDYEPAAVEQYVTKNKIPWITLYEKATPGRHPAMEHYGIYGIPAKFLVGRDGNVLSVDPDTETLSALLEQQLAPGNGEGP